jgi:hypothetical protein
MGLKVDGHGILQDEDIDGFGFRAEVSIFGE